MSREYIPSGALKQVFECRDPEVLVEGPAGTGKTTADLWKIRLLCEKYPGSRHWLGRDTRSAMTESVLVTLEEKVLGPTHPVVVNGPTRGNRSEYRFDNGSVMVIGGLDKPERTFSAEYDTMWVFEAVEVSDEGKFELLQRALRNGKMPYQQIVAETNPSAPTHWLNRRAEAGKMTRIVTRHEDNPYLWDEAAGEWTERGRQYIAKLDALSGHRKARLRSGKWVAAEGVVYEEFDSRIHVIDKMPDGWQSWTKYRVIDFGFIDPFVCQWWAVSGECAIMYREIYTSNRIVEDHAKRIVELSQGERYDCTIADHDREDRETLARHGVQTMPANKELLYGIDVAKTRLTLAANGRPKACFLRSATVEFDERLADSKRPTSTVAEFDCYAYKRRPDGIAKDQPEDKDNHGMDAFRYLCVHLYGGLAVLEDRTPPPIDIAKNADKLWRAAPRVQAFPQRRRF